MTPTHKTPTALALALAVALSASPALGQEAPVEATEARPERSSLEVVGTYRPVDITQAGLGPAAQAGLDLYLSTNPQAGLSPGQRFDVFRRVPAPAVDIEMVIKVGELQIVTVQPTVAVARVIGGPDQSAQPHLKTPGVVVGDYIMPDSPKVEPKPVARRRQRRKPAEKASKASEAPRIAAKDPAPDEVVVKKPSSPGASTDTDSFQFWDERPIDF